MPRLAGTGLDLDDAVGNLRDLEFEESLDQAGVGPADDDLRSLGGLADLDDVGLHACVGLGPLVRHLLGLGQQRLDPTQVEQRVTGIRLLDHAGDDVTLPTRVLLVLQVALGLADPLRHDVTGGLRRDPAEVVRRHVELVADRLALLVEVLGEHPDLHGVRVDRDPGELMGSRGALVGGLEGIGQGCEQRFQRDAPLRGHGLEGLHHVRIHRSTSLSSIA